MRKTMFVKLPAAKLAKGKARPVLIGVAGYLITAAALLGHSAFAGAPPFA